MSPPWHLIRVYAWSGLVWLLYAGSAGDAAKDFLDNVSKQADAAKESVSKQAEAVKQSAAAAVEDLKSQVRFGG